MNIKLPPAFELPSALNVPTHRLELPSFNVPKWEPIPVYREDVPGISKEGAPEPIEKEEEPAVKPKPTESIIPELPIYIPRDLIPPLPSIPEVIKELPEVINSEIGTITIPLVDVELPVPSSAILVTAVSTATVAAVASVGGTLAANALFKQLVQVLKPIITAALKKVSKARGKKVDSWARQRRKLRRLRQRDNITADSSKR